MVAGVLRVAVPAIALFFLLRLWPVDEATVAILRKVVAVLMIVGVAWFLRKAVVLSERAILGQRDLTGAKSRHGHEARAAIADLDEQVLAFLGGHEVPFG